MIFFMIKHLYLKLSELKWLLWAHGLTFFDLYARLYVTKQQEDSFNIVDLES